MYQAVQNVLHGFGSICGASLGGLIADSIGWRWCFLFQVPISLLALVVGYYAVKNFKPSGLIVEGNVVQVESKSVWRQIDLSGSVLLVLGLSAQLAALSMGGNDFSWTDWPVIVSLVLSVVLLVAFVVVELRTRAIPIMPMGMFKGGLAISNILSNVCVGMAAYGVSHSLPASFVP
jgi:MFS family permease